MAKRKKKSHRRRSSRRSFGMMGAIDTTNILTVAAGAVGAKMLDKVIPDTIDAKLVAAGKIALGIALPMVVKDGKSKNVMQGLGSGLIAVGAIDLVSSFGILSGVGADDKDMLVVSLDGVDDLPVVNGDDDLPVVNGQDDVLGADVLHGVEDDIADIE